jgi:FkbM family methyltransferase
LRDQHGLEVIGAKQFKKLMGYKKAAGDLAFYRRIDKRLVGELLHLKPQSKSQFRQDLFVLAELGLKRDGYFVEFGAADGVVSSNSHLLEKHFNWSGILAEPAKIWRQALPKNRTAHIDFDCVWAVSGEELEFTETKDPFLSTVAEFADQDNHAAIREGGQRYQVKTVSLNDLLARYEAPAKIDYLSIDTEGTELAILENFDFNRHQFSVITCEHNHTPARADIHRLLTAHGYVRKFEDLSDVDDWYVRG